MISAYLSAASRVDIHWWWNDQVCDVLGHTLWHQDISRGWKTDCSSRVPTETMTRSRIQTGLL